MSISRKSIKPIVVIDYGVGNHRSITNALEHLGCDFVVTKDPNIVMTGAAFILPGVGSFAEAAKNLKSTNLGELIKQEVLCKKKPILGICLGMQLLADYSEEGGVNEGLGLIPGAVKKLDHKEYVHVPHIGWNDLTILKPTPLFTATSMNPDFYFDHSYQFSTLEEFVSSRCTYGNSIIASVQKDHIFGVQFHPEKSQRNGWKLFRSFLNETKRLSEIQYQNV